MAPITNHQAWPPENFKCFNKNDQVKLGFGLLVLCCATEKKLTPLTDKSVKLVHHFQFNDIFIRCNPFSQIFV